jgi:hypothetical protein
VVANGLRRPAGLAFSPDYRTLYVSELIGGHDGVYIHAYDVTYSNSPEAPSFDISGVPNIKHAAGGSSGSATTSSPQVSAQYHRGQPYATPDSSPQFRAATLAGRPSLRSRTGSHTRSHDMSNHKFLSSMTNGLRTPSRGPTGEPTSIGPSTPPSTAFSSRTRKCGTFLSIKGLLVYTPNATATGAITTDPVHGHLWLGTEEGVEVWNADSGELTGKILVEEWDSQRTDEHSLRRKTRGVSKVVFTSDNDALLLGGERIWQLRMGPRRTQGG